jgi:hypothetical protein
MSRRVGLLRVVAWAGWTLAALSLVALAAAWWVDRHRVWEEPRWMRERFVVIADRPRAPGDTAETWAIAFNPSCSHCLESLARASRLRVTANPVPRLALLVIDAPRDRVRMPVASEAIDQIWWDVHGVWRRRWGHRVYGEVLRFDAAGRYRGIVPPDAGRDRGS